MKTTGTSLIYYVNAMHLIDNTQLFYILAKIAAIGTLITICADAMRRNGDLYARRNGQK